MILIPKYRMKKFLMFILKNFFLTPRGGNICRPRGEDSFII